MEKTALPAWIWRCFRRWISGGEVSGMYAPVAVLSGAVVIDNSSRWRMDKDVPLVVPEINLADARGKKLVANPNCSTIQAALPLWALRDTVPHSVAFTTFQAVSGTGKRGLDALENARAGRADDFFGTDISSTCLPQIGAFLSDGSTEEEVKMINETKKILHRPDLKISATCVRVPVPNGHGVSIVMRAGRDFKTEEVISALKAQEGIVLKDVLSNDLKICDDLLFTHFGISGPLAYKISSIKARENFPYKLSFDLYPKEIELQKFLNNSPHKDVKNILADFLPSGFVKYILSDLADIKAHKIDGKTRDLILDKIHNFEVIVTGTNKGEETVTAGGVKLNEVNPKTMEAKKYPHIYFIGEILDIDGFCGGFNLQNAWSTAFVAAEAISSY